MITISMINRPLKTLIAWTAAAGAFALASGIHAQEASEPAPGNIIVIVADGWGYNQMEAASIYQHGWRGGQSYQNFPVRLAVATYSHHGSYDPDVAWNDFEYFRHRPTDSASSATALSTGVITRDGYIGLDPDEERLTHLAERAKERGKSAGVVSSVQISHATPASFIAHNISRNNYRQIGRQMIEDTELDVIMGGGHPLYDDNAREAGEPDFQYIGGRRVWERIAAGEAGGDRPWTFVESLEEFRDLISGETPERVLGIPTVRSTLQFFRAGNGDADPFAAPANEGVPTLVEMTLGAINVLNQNDEGFFLHVEAGAIDWAGHRNNSPRMIEEHVDFDNTVQAVIEWVEEHSSWEETLVIVTGDHETGYLTGPDSGPEARPLWQPIENRGKGVLPGMQWHSGGHTNQLIPLFAKGAGSERLHDHVIDIDPERGPYIHLTAVGKLGFSLLED
jgi:alkaline phosphatase